MEMLVCVVLFVMSILATAWPLAGYLTYQKDDPATRKQLKLGILVTVCFLVLSVAFGMRDSANKTGLFRGNAALRESEKACKASGMLWIYVGNGGYDCIPIPPS